MQSLVLEADPRLFQELTEIKQQLAALLLHGNGRKAEREVLPELPAFGFLQAEQAAKIFGIHKNTWFAWRRRGIISQGVKLGYKRVGWTLEEIRSLYEGIRSGAVILRDDEETE